MKEPRWLPEPVIRAIHSDQVRKHGGSLGLRDEGLLDSALARPRNLFHYEAEADLCALCALAAAHGLGIARNHPFVDGNKRVAFQAMYAFLGINGLRIDATEPEVVETMLSVARGELEEAELAEWLRGHTGSR